MIARFGGSWYLYGTSYACGFEWPVLSHRADSPWCGFVVLRSTDLIHWTNRTPLFDPSPYQGRCSGRTGGCFNVRVVYDANSGKYVAWWNQPRLGLRAYAVATASSPMGPFTEVNGGECCSTMQVPFPVSDATLFVDTDGRAYASTDDHDFGRHVSSSVIRRLSDDYTTELPGDTVVQWPAQEEGQAIFRRGDTYYLLVGSDCGYCKVGTTLRYATAPAMSGPWVDRGALPGNDCHGQDTAVTAIDRPGGSVFLLQADQWLGLANETRADQRWVPLGFGPDGELRAPDCQAPYFSLAAA